MADISVRGWNELEKKLRSNDLFAAAMRDLFNEAGKYGKAQLEKRAPKGKTKVLSSSNLVVTDVKTLPNNVLRFWIKFTNNALSASGYRYGFALNAGRRKTADGYTDFMRSRTGKPTKSWFRGAQGTLRNHIRQNVRKAGQAIEGRWKGK